MFSSCSTLKDLSIDVSIGYIDTYMGTTDIDEAKVISVLRRKSEFEFQTFLKRKFEFWGFYAEVLVKTFPLMYQLLM